MERGVQVREVGVHRCCGARRAGGDNSGSPTASVPGSVVSCVRGEVSAQQAGEPHPGWSRTGCNTKSFEGKSNLQRMVSGDLHTPKFSDCSRSTSSRPARPE